MAANNASAQGSAQATIDHDEIREWVEQQGGHPAEVKRTRRGDTPGILRIDFPGFSGEDTLEEISWDEFFERFEESKLAFLYRDETKSGRPSRFNKLVSRDSVEIRTNAPRAAGPRSRRAAGETSRSQRRSPEPSTSTAGRRKPTAARRAARKTTTKEQSPAPARRSKRSTRTARSAEGTSSMPRTKKRQQRGTSAEASNGTKRAVKKRSARKSSTESKRSSARR